MDKIKLYKIGEMLGLDKYSIDGILVESKLKVKVSPQSSLSIYKQGAKYGTLSIKDF